jgi:uncharacterized protein (DUF1330 family)
MPAYLIARVTIDDAARYREYTAHTPRCIADHGGRFLVRNGARVHVEGPEDPRRIIVIEFSGMAQAQTFYTSADYAAVKALRAGAGEMESVLIDGFPEAEWQASVAASRAIALPELVAQGSQTKL